MAGQDAMVEINEGDVDEASDGAIALRVNDALASLDLCYAGVNNDGVLLLETTSEVTADLSDDELTARVAAALDECGLRERLKLRGYRIASSSS